MEKHSEIARALELSVDEDMADCKKGKELADEFLMSLGNLEDLDKQEIVPLQGNCWKQWSKYDKEVSRHKMKGNKDPTQYADELRTKLDNCQAWAFKFEQM